MSRVRYSALATALAGVMFILYPAVRPWHDETTLDGAIASLSSSSWVYSHLFAMIGFILVPAGMLALRKTLRETKAERTAFLALVFSWLGAGLVLPYYGAEDFGLHTIAKQAASGQPIDVVAASEAFRYQPLAMSMFAGGLLLLAVAGVLAAVAVWRSGVLPRYSGLLFGIGYALFLPQFFTPPAARIAHGIILGAGLFWLAAALWRANRIEPAA